MQCDEHDDGKRTMRLLLRRIVRHYPASIRDVSATHGYPDGCLR